jgi:hypothetical protein
MIPEITEIKKEATSIKILLFSSFNFSSRYFSASLERTKNEYVSLLVAIK